MIYCVINCWLDTCATENTITSSPLLVNSKPEIKPIQQDQWLCSCIWDPNDPVVSTIWLRWVYMLLMLLDLSGASGKRAGWSLFKLCADSTYWVCKWCGFTASCAFGFFSGKQGFSHMLPFAGGSKRSSTHAVDFRTQQRSSLVRPADLSCIVSICQRQWLPIRPHALTHSLMGPCWM